jgi:cell division protein FtsL
MSATRTAPRRAPASRPERAPRPELRVVDAAALPTSRALTRVVTVLAGLLAAAGLFLVVCLHVLLTQGQADLDSLRARAEAESARNRRLRVQVAELESPSRIVSAARERLSMVPPATVIYLPVADPTRPLPPVSSEPLPPPTTVPATKPAAPTTAVPAQKKSSTPTTITRSTTPTTARKAASTTTPTAATSGGGG